MQCTVYITARLHMMSFSVKMMSSCTQHVQYTTMQLYRQCFHSVFQTITMATGTFPRYPPTEHPVLAFKGAPARFPVIREHRSLHQYLKWSKNMNQQAEDYITTQLQGQPYISVHLRMGSDWVRGNTTANIEIIKFFTLLALCCHSHTYK